VAKEAPVGFRAIRLHFQLDAGAAQEQIDTLLEPAERYAAMRNMLQAR
jgi:hypothetical protein